MKGLAFALDPDGYWVELLRGGKKGQNTLAQTMLRVKELEDGGILTYKMGSSWTWNKRTHILFTVQKGFGHRFQDGFV